MENTKETQVQPQNSSSNNEVIIARFRKEREDWMDKVTDMSNRMKDIHHLSDLMTDIYSSRQIALEYSHTLMVHLSKVNRIYRERRTERYDHYTRNYDIRLDKDPKNDLINVDLADLLEKRDLLQNHLDYFRETIKTIDTLCYGIKHRMSLEEYKRG